MLGAAEVRFVSDNENSLSPLSNVEHVVTIMLDQLKCNSNQEAKEYWGIVTERICKPLHTPYHKPNWAGKLLGLENRT